MDKKNDSFFHLTYQHQLMPRPRRVIGPAQFIDHSAIRDNAGESDRAPVIHEHKEAVQYNAAQDHYARELNRYATSVNTRVKPQYVRVPKKKKASPKAVMAVVSQPVLPAALTRAKAVREPGQPTKAELARKAAAKKLADYRRAQPGTYVPTLVEMTNIQGLIAGGVNELTECIRERKKTRGYNGKVVPMKRRVLKDGGLGVQRYRLVSTCASCHAQKSNILSSGPSPPRTVHGGRISTKRRS